MPHVIRSVDAQDLNEVKDRLVHVDAECPGSAHCPQIGAGAQQR